MRLRERVSGEQIKYEAARQQGEGIPTLPGAPPPLRHRGQIPPAARGCAGGGAGRRRGPGGGWCSGPVGARARGTPTLRKGTIPSLEMACRRRGAPVRLCSPAPHVEKKEPMTMTHGDGHARVPTTRFPLTASPNLRGHRRHPRLHPVAKPREHRCHGGKSQPPPRQVGHRGTLLRAGTGPGLR